MMSTLQRVGVLGGDDERVVGVVVAWTGVGEGEGKMEMMARRRWIGVKTGGSSCLDDPVLSHWNL